jgi:hypothetical protein
MVEIHNGPVRKIALLKDELEFWYVNVYNYRNPRLTKVSAPILGEAAAVDIYIKCLEMAEA